MSRARPLFQPLCPPCCACMPFYACTLPLSSQIPHVSTRLSHAQRCRYTSCTTDAATVLFSVQAPTIAPTAVGIDTAADTPAPTNGDGGRGIGATAPPTAAVSGSGQVEETTSPIESDQAGSSNGAVGAGSGVAAGSAVLLSCLVGLWVFIAL